MKKVLSSVLALAMVFAMALTFTSATMVKSIRLKLLLLLMRCSLRSKRLRNP